MGFESSLADYLEQHVGGFAGPVKLQKFSGGQSNPTYLLSAASGEYVLRRQPQGELLPSAHAVDREFRVIDALRDSAVPVASAIHLCEDKTVLGSMFYLMSYEKGRVFWDPALPELERSQRREIIEQQLKVLAALHEVDVDAVGLGDYGPRENYYARQFSRWSEQYRTAETEHIASMEALMNWLETRIPETSGKPRLIHGDYRLDNLIYHPDQPRILALLDWELSTLGDPIADLAYLCMCMRLPQIGTVKGLGGEDPAELGVPDEEEIIALYCAQRNLDEIENWSFCLAFSFFRIAAICQGVFKRAQDGNASDALAVERGNLTPELAGMAMMLIESGE
jgi:aminoglycoside phosphotransferase (APT) family kinase protein